MEAPVAMPSTSLRAKRTLYIGGLEESVKEDVVRAAFIPFGELSDVQVPMDHVKQTNKGYAFVEFEEEGDAKDALENMNNAELYGRTLRVTIARAPRTNRTQAVWADADAWYSSLHAEVEGSGAATAGASASSAAAAVSAAVATSASVSK